VSEEPVALQSFVTAHLVTECHEQDHTSDFQGTEHATDRTQRGTNPGHHVTIATKCFTAAVRILRWLVYFCKHLCTVRSKT